MLSPSLGKLTLTVHVIAAVGWSGALAAFLAQALAGWLGQDAQLQRAMALSMGVTAWYVILPLALTAFATGLIQALGTPWGLLRHYWVVFKLLLGSVATVVLLLKLGPIAYLADAAAGTGVPGADDAGLRQSLTIHAAGGLVVLLAAATLAFYKPRGLTRYGARRRRPRPGAMSRAALAAGTPGWVKGFGIALGLLALALIVMLLGGGHGPGVHGPG